MSDLKKVWLITGCSRGIGRSLSEAVLAAGNELVATARNPEQIKDLAERFGDKVKICALDVKSETDAVSAVKTAIDSFGRLDVLVNNAGYGTLKSIEETSIAEFRAKIETNLFGTIIVTKAVLPFMRKQRYGHIIQFSSVGGRIGPIGRGPYAAAKWGVEGFSEVLSKEVTPLGIKVTIIEPGGFRTDFAGKSAIIKESLADYENTVGRTAQFQHDYNGKQPGDPAKAANIMIQITHMEQPPLQLLLGSDAVNAVEQNDLAKIEADKKWRHLSTSADIN